jgi:hypothetical protein
VKSAVIRQRFSNQSLDLRSAVGIDQRYQGYVVESVQVDVRYSTPNTAIDLVINGSIDSSASAMGRVTLTPRYQAVIDRGVRDLQISVRGLADIDAVYVNLRRQGGGGHGGGGWQDVQVPVSVYRHLNSNDRIDLAQLVNLSNYQGYRISSIDIEGNSTYQSALVDVVINGFNQGQSLQFGPRSQVLSAYPQNVVIGQNASSIVLFTRGDMDIRSVTIRLSRR